jgi:hypothetical protein
MAMRRPIKLLSCRRHVRLKGASWMAGAMNQSTWEKENHAIVIRGGDDIATKPYKSHGHNKGRIKIKPQLRALALSSLTIN